MEQSANTKERFSETNESFTMLEAINEAKRCLHCKAPQCSKGCPISQDIPDWIHELSMGNLGNAMHIINGKSNLPAVCGRVCPHERQCEGHCVLGKKGRPVAIGKLERFVADFDGDMQLIRERLAAAEDAWTRGGDWQRTCRTCRRRRPCAKRLRGGGLRDGTRTWRRTDVRHS